VSPKHRDSVLRALHEVIVRGAGGPGLSDADRHYCREILGAASRDPTLAGSAFDLIMSAEQALKSTF
jgi:hypothetical protein